MLPLVLVTLVTGVAARAAERRVLAIVVVAFGPLYLAHEVDVLSLQLDREVKLHSLVEINIPSAGRPGWGRRRRRDERAAWNL